MAKSNKGKIYIEEFGMDRDFRWIVEYNYSSAFNGKGDTIISNVKIQEASVLAILNSMSLRYGGPCGVEKYCADRILRYHRVWEHDLWDIPIFGGYYGDEIREVRYRGFEAINRHLLQMLELKEDTDKLFFVLELEYGYILDCLVGKIFHLEKIQKSKLLYNEVYCRKIDYVKEYEEYPQDMARGICVKQGDNYRLIDGYHRVGMVRDNNPFPMYVGI